jgi:hypothetical protein
MANQSIIDLLIQNGFLRPDAVLSLEDERALGRLTPEDVAALVRIKDLLGQDFWDRHATPRVDLIF